MRSPGGGSCGRLVLALAVLASCISVTPAFARGTEETISPAAVATAPPVETMVLSKAPVTAIDSGRFLVIETHAAVLLVRHDSVVAVESRDSSTIVFRLAESAERSRDPALHSALNTRNEPPNRYGDRILTRIESESTGRSKSARVAVAARNHRQSYRV